MNNATKTIPQILRDNICTVFNALNLMIAIALAAAGAWKNILFLFIILINTAVGITQEIRAKRQIERLTLLTQPAVTVLRGGAEQTIRPEEIRRGDLMVLTAGCAVCTDCTVQEGRLEVNEAILTGESEPVVKLPGDRLLSGSSVISGRCLAQAECAADECFTAQMVDEVKKTKTGSSELLASMKRVTRFTSFLIVPLGVLLFVQAVFLRGTPVDAAVVATSAGLLGMLPKGLVLLISIGLAVGVIRLSKKNVLVRDLHSLENLAHCDVVCLDKTGTLTEGSLTVEGVYPNMDGREFRRLMATYLVHTDDNNSTYRALSERFSREEPYEITAATPFSSERKWSSVTLADGRTLVLGAPERLCRTIPPEAEALMAQGKRILFVGLCSGEVDTAKIDRIAMIVIADKLRRNAAQTIRYFYEQGVDVKIISGDHPAAAAAVARLSGVRNAGRLLDATGLTDEELTQAAGTHTVFGRVTPQQKKVLVAALQKQGHRVAMTGDGVNDLLAMRQADCSAAMGNGSDAAKQAAQLVLLDSDFAVLRDVISEGRRVVNNLTKSAGVFFIKTIYSVLLSILCLILNTDFPFIPIQITLIDAVIEAFPAFFMFFERSDRRVEGSFLDSALRSALPNGIAIFLGCIAVFFAAPRLGLNHAQMNLVTFFMVRLYTGVLTPAEYGTGDLLITTVSLLMPFVSFGISDGVFRFLPEYPRAKKSIFSIGIYTVTAGAAVLAALLPLLRLVESLQGYSLMLAFLTLAACYHAVCEQYVRAAGDTLLYAKQGLLNTVLVVSLNLLFLMVLRLGVSGYVLSVGLADTLCTAYLVCRQRLWQRLTLRPNRKLLKRMLRYSIPLIPTTVFWWITSVSDRYMISAMLGSEANGICTVANKLPSLLTLLSGVLMQAWQYSAVSESKSSLQAQAEFYSNVWLGLLSMLFLVCSAMVALTKIEIRILADAAYQEAWRYVPVLCAAMLLCAFTSFDNVQFSRT